MAFSFPIEGDGCVPGIYHYLWSKNQDGQSCPSINVPDTVVYKYRQPAYWYFSSFSEKEGQRPGIKMKKKENLGNAKVEEVFTRPGKPKKGDTSKPCEIVAYYIATQDTQNPVTGDIVTTIEHFDADGLRDFLFYRDKENNGILQRFFPPKGDRNCILRAVWSPKIFYAERRTNLHGLADHKLPFHCRAVTFEGPEHYSDIISITDARMGEQLKQLTLGLVRHLHAVSDGAVDVGRIVLHFKIDANERVWFLWCSSLRLVRNEFSMEPSMPMALENELQVSPYIMKVLDDGKDQKVSDPSISRQRVLQCPMCVERLPPSNRCEATYKMLIEYIETVNDRAFRAAEILFDEEAMKDVVSSEEDVPLVLRRLHPNMTMDNYMLLRNDPLFQFSRLSLCDLCFLKITRELYPKLPMVEPVAVPACLRPSTVVPLDLDLINSESPFRGHGGATSSLLKPKAKRVLPLSQSTIAAAAARARAASSLGENASPGEGAFDPTASKIDATATLEYEGSLAPYRSTRLAENYVTSVSQQSMIKQLERKFASLPLPLPPLPPSFNSNSTPAYIETDIPIPSLPEASDTVQRSLVGAIDPTQSAFSVSALQMEEAARPPLPRPRPPKAAGGGGAAGDFRSGSPTYGGGGPPPLGGRHVPDNFPPIPTRHQGLDFSTYKPGKAVPYKKKEEDAKESSSKGLGRKSPSIKVKAKEGAAKEGVGKKGEKSEGKGDAGAEGGGEESRSATRAEVHEEAAAAVAAVAAAEQLPPKHSAAEDEAGGGD